MKNHLKFYFLLINASRPNAPVNICIGALIIKEVFGISDDEIVENLMLYPRYQYALHTASCEEQPLSDKTLLRFRKRCYDYESAYGIDLLHNCITSLSEKIAKMMDLNPQIKRMDSMMIAANIRKPSRTELLYTCVVKLAGYLHKNNPEVRSGDFGHYCEPNDYNRTFYYNNDSETDNRLKNILEDADKLLSICGSDYDDVTEYQLLIRCLSEQTVVKEAVRRLRTKEDGGLHSGILQNPSDPDATFRGKAGKEHRRYYIGSQRVSKNSFDPNIIHIERFQYCLLGCRYRMIQSVLVICQPYYLNFFQFPDCRRHRHEIWSAFQIFLIHLSGSYISYFG